MMNTRLLLLSWDSIVLGTVRNLLTFEMRPRPSLIIKATPTAKLKGIFFQAFLNSCSKFCCSTHDYFLYFLLKLAGKSNYKLVEKIMQENWKSSCCMIWKLLALMIKSRIRKWEIRVKNSYCENLLGPLSDDHHYWFRKINVKNKELHTWLMNTPQYSFSSVWANMLIRK